MLTSLLFLLGTAEAKKKPKVPPPPPTGWHREEGWNGECYFPPDYGPMLESDRKLARQKALEAMKTQWLGERDDGVSLDPYVVETVEETLPQALHHQQVALVEEAGEDGPCLGERPAVHIAPLVEHLQYSIEVEGD